MKKYIVLNVMPFLVWILWFVCQFNNIFVPADSVDIQLGLLFYMPIVFALINLVFAKNEKLFLCFNGVFAAAHILGCYISGVLYYSFISNDTETELVNNTFSLISILYIFIITIIFLLVRIIFKKIKKNQKNRIFNIFEGKLI